MYNFLSYEITVEILSEFNLKKIEYDYMYAYMCLLDKIIFVVIFSRYFQRLCDVPAFPVKRHTLYNENSRPLKPRVTRCA